MSGASSQRKELSNFLAESAGGPRVWRILHISASPRMGSIFDISMFKFDHPQNFWRIYACNTADFAIRPPNPRTMEGGPEIKFSTDDPRLADPALQYVPGGDGEVYDPPRRYQLLELDQSWIIAERFEIEPR